MSSTISSKLLKIGHGVQPSAFAVVTQPLWRFIQTALECIHFNNIARVVARLILSRFFTHVLFFLFQQGVWRKWTTHLFTAKMAQASVFGNIFKTWLSNQINIVFFFFLPFINYLLCFLTNNAYCVTGWFTHENTGIEFCVSLLSHIGAPMQLNTMLLQLSHAVENSVVTSFKQTLNIFVYVCLQCQNR